MNRAKSESAINAIIYDLDGVLVSTDEFHFLAWKQMADEETIPFDRDTNERLRGVSRMESLAIILERSVRAYTQAEQQELAQRKNSYYVKSLEKLGYDSVLDGALETVTKIRNLGILQAVGSSSKNARTILNRTGLTHLFDAVVDGTMISRSKPDPEVFLKAAAALDVPPERCLVVEDAVAGVQAGIAAGMRCFAVGNAAIELRSRTGEGTPWRSAPDLSGDALFSAVRTLLEAPRNKD